MVENWRPPLRWLFAANEDSFVVLLFIVVCLVQSLFLTLGPAPAAPMG
jgi:hypothetical protein